MRSPPNALACPFCGRGDRLFVQPDGFTESGHEPLPPYTAGCSNCQATSGPADTEGEAVAEWNRRPTGSPSEDLAVWLDQQARQERYYETKWARAGRAEAKAAKERARRFDSAAAVVRERGMADFYAGCVRSMALRIAGMEKELDEIAVRMDSRATLEDAWVHSFADEIRHVVLQMRVEDL